MLSSLYPAIQLGPFHHFWFQVSLDPLKPQFSIDISFSPYFSMTKKSSQSITFSIPIKYPHDFHLFIQVFLHHFSIYIISTIIKPWLFPSTWSHWSPNYQVEELDLHLTDLTHCCASPGACLVVAWQVGHALDFKGDLSRAGSMDKTAMRKQTFHLEVTVRL